MIWRYAASTDVGLVRDLNEDSMHVDDSLALIADGMGGAAAGEVASAIAVQEIVRSFALDSSRQGVLNAIERANSAILADANEHAEHIGMGTTAVFLALTTSTNGPVPVVVNIGDSRAYQLRDGALRQITTDHSVAEEWVRAGRLTPEEAAVHPRRHQITRTLGLDVPMEPDVFSLAVEQGDRVLLCSDGLSNELTDDEIARLASAPVPLDEAVATLVEQANERGGRDNITVVLVEFVEPVHHDVESSPVTDSATVSVSPETSAPAVKRRRRRARPRFTWRTAVFLLALAGVVALAFEVVNWYAYSSYYLADNHGYVAVFHGQPNGTLWFKPKFVENTIYPVKQLRSSDRALLAQGILEPTVKAAETSATYLHREWRTLFPPPTTTTTTTTTIFVGTT